MQFGLTAWCTDRSLGPAETAVAAEAAGVGMLLFPDHTHIPVARTSPYPGGGEMPEYYTRNHDPLVASAYALAATTTLEVGIGVCLVPARDPIVLAKQVASLDHLSNGRFVLGVGAGWNAEEIADHGVDPAERWAVMRERVLAMKEIWTRDQPSYRGEHVSFEPMWSWPKPARKPHPPIIVGGHGARVLDRVVEYGDEWLAMVAPGLPPLRDRIAELTELAERRGRERPRVAVQVYGSPPDERVIERYVGIGVDRIVLSLPHAGPDDAMAAFDQLGSVIARWSG